MSFCVLPSVALKGYVFLTALSFSGSWRCWWPVPAVAGWGQGCTHGWIVSWLLGPMWTGYLGISPYSPFMCDQGWDAGSLQGLGPGPGCCRCPPPAAGMPSHVLSVLGCISAQSLTDWATAAPGLPPSQEIMYQSWRTTYCIIHYRKSHSLVNYVV